MMDEGKLPAGQGFCGVAAQYLAHSANKEGIPDALAVHLTRVAERAAESAQAYGASLEARITGILHDIGKYGDLFQRRLEGKEHGIDHWSAGAWEALTRYKMKGIAAALAIQGHHIGLQAASPDHLRELEPHRCEQRIHPRRLSGSHDQILTRMRMDGIVLPDAEELSSLYSGHDSGCAGMLDVRLLFSALVDADYLETSSHFGAGSLAPSLPLNAESALSALIEYVCELRRSSVAAADINTARDLVFDSCLSAGSQSPGLYTLTAPTGAGKTLAMLAFALAHALSNKLRRIVVVLPYLTIIEQTAQVYERVFGSCIELGPYNRYVMEDHSLAGTRFATSTGMSDPDPDCYQERGRMEESRSWDAPIVITTTVQMLESLFANRAGACRKLHALPKSVLLFDEVQTLPLPLAIPTLASLSHLSRAYGSSIIFSTATQPAFTHLDSRVRVLGGDGWLPAELVSDQQPLSSLVKRRVQVEWPGEETVGWMDVAEEMLSRESALCIVNLKRHAAELFSVLASIDEEGMFHLSTNMCPLHRQHVLSTVRSRLDAGRPCRLVATQCVEAGVDLDFPFILRALAPLDSIAQAAGRCNRNGRLSSGLVRVFVPADEAYPDTAYSRAASVTRGLLRLSGPEGPDLSSRSIYDRYYRMLYDMSQPEKSRALLVDAIKRHDFPEVARLYRLIPRNAVNVVVPYDALAFDRLCTTAAKGGVNSLWINEARHHAVSVFTPEPSDPLYSVVTAVSLKDSTLSEQWFVWRDHEGYDMQLGLVVPAESRCLIA